jgi:hypothetical protein
MLTTKNTVIATYTERLPQVCRVFNLYCDRVEIVARWTIGKKYQVTVPLSNLSGKITHFTVKNRWFSKAVMIGSLMIGAALVFSRIGYSDLIRRMAIICWPIAGAAFVVAALSFPKRQFVHFQKRDGNPGLDICKTGSQARFDIFVSILRKHIMQIKKN